MINFDKQMNMLPKEGFNNFEEADAAADAEQARAESAEDAASAYGANSVTRKSAFRGSQSKPNDGFARVTWTDLAMGRKD